MYLCKIIREIIMDKVSVRILLALVLTISLNACQTSSQERLKEKILRVEDSLKTGRYDVVMQMIADQMKTAADSDVYYRWVSEQNSVWYAQMNGDSMMANIERIHQYLQRHQEDEPLQRRILRAEWLRGRGVLFSSVLGQNDSAVVFTKQALKVMEGIEGEEGIRLALLTNCAYYYQLLGQQDLSADYYLQALFASDSINVGDDTKAAIMLGICSAYTSMGDYANSKLWWEQTGELLPHMSTDDKFIYYNGRGNDYYFQQKYGEASDCFRQAASLVKDDKYKAWSYYTALVNLGEVFVCLGKADSARAMIHQADTFFRKVNFAPALYYLKTAAIKLETLEGHTDRALSLANSDSENDVMVPAYKLPRLEAIEKLMVLTGNYRAAYDAYHEMSEIKDSIQGQNSRMQLSLRLKQFEHDKRLMEQQRTLEKTRNNSRLAWLLVVVAIMTLMLLAGGFHLYRRRSQFHELKMRHQIVNMRMQSVRNRITPHFIYNALNHEVLAQMKGEKVDLNGLTHLLRRGIEQAEELQTTLAEELGFVDYYVEIEGRQLGPDFCYSKDIAPDVDLKAVKLPAMTVQIFVENAIKHGLRPMAAEEGRQRRLTVRVTRCQGSTLVEVLDNGRGLQHQTTDGVQTGLRVVRQTIQQLNEHNSCPITFGIDNRSADGESGCRSWISLPDEYNYQVAVEE